MDPSRWEHGSDFHLSSEVGALEAPWGAGPATLWGSGRDAMRGLLRWGRDERGWTRLLVPSFFCESVVAVLAGELPVARYEDAPDAAPPLRVEAERSDVLLLVNTYGMRSRPRVDTRALVVEDHTHDPLSPWAFASEADYAVASLRKTLPLPDGGVLWSPKTLPLPAEREATERHAAAASARATAMRLKREYLEGGLVEKAEYRALAATGERAIGRGEVSGITAESRARLPTLPAREWRERRERNLAAFRRALGPVAGARLLEAPFAATLVFDSAERRESVRRALVAASIYPAVLWPLETAGTAGIPPRDRALSRRVLSLHCDFRYDERDMRRVADALREALAGGSANRVPGREADGTRGGLVSLAIERKVAAVVSRVRAGVARLDEGRVGCLVGDDPQGPEGVAVGREAGLEREQAVFGSAHAAAEVEPSLAALPGPAPHEVKEELRRPLAEEALVRPRQVVLDEPARLHEEPAPRDLAADLDQAEVEALPERFAQVGEVAFGEEVVRVGADAGHGRAVESGEVVQVLEALVHERAVPGPERLPDLVSVGRAGGAPELLFRAGEVDGDRGPVLDHGADLRGKGRPQDRVATHEEGDDALGRELATGRGEGVAHEGIVPVQHQRPRIAVGGGGVAGSRAGGAEDDREQHPARPVPHVDRAGLPSLRPRRHLHVRRQVVEVVVGFAQEHLPVRGVGGQEVDLHGARSGDLGRRPTGRRP